MTLVRDNVLRVGDTTVVESTLVSISVEADGQVVRSAAGQIIAPRLVRPDSLTGEWSIDLPPLDEPGASPLGAVYRVDVGRTTYHFALLTIHGPGPLDVETLLTDPPGALAPSGLATHTALTTTAHGGLVAEDDPRFTDARTPSAHAPAHATGGTDAVTPVAIGAETPAGAQAKVDAEAAARIAADALREPLRTVRATLVLGGSGYTVGAVGATPDWNGRMLVGTPVTTTRWRMRLRNYAVIAEAAGVGEISCAGVWVGDPSIPAPRWGGAFVTAPPRVIEPFVLNDSAVGDTFTPWVTDPTQQFRAGKPRGFSFGCTADATSVFRYDAGMACLWRGGAGQAAASGAAPAGGAFSPINAMMDCRIEYEALLPVSAPVTLVIGDSIAAGYTGGDGGGYPHETWPAIAAGRGRYPTNNLAVPGSTMAQWATGGAGWKLARADLATTVPDRAIIALGTNDIAALPATLQANLLTVITTLRNLGIPEIWLATLPPWPASASEPNRAAYNAFVRDVPYGVAGVVDLDEALRVQAAPTTAESQWMTAYPHPKRPGFQRMSTASP